MHTESDHWSLLDRREIPKGIPLTAEGQSRKRHEIFAAATRLFLKQGFIETSMHEIAAAAGMSKSSLYDCFRSKDDILIWYFLATHLLLMTIMPPAFASRPSSTPEVTLNLFLRGVQA